MDGMRRGLVTSMASFSYTRTVGIMANPSPGQGVSNQFGSELQPDGTYRALGGVAIRNIPSDVLENNYNIIGQPA